MPVQFHTALINEDIFGTDPINLSNFLSGDTYKTKIVLLHAGYPLFSNAKAMAMAARLQTVNNVYIDISGRIMMGNHPAIIAKMLRDFLDIPALWDKIIYGSDALLGERYILTCAQTGREAVYLAVSGMIDDGIVDENTGIVIAKGILRNNAIKLYNMPFAKE